MKTNKQIKRWLLKNCVDKDGTLKINNIDLSDFDGNVDINYWNVKNTLNISCQKIGLNLYQNNQIVGENLYQNGQIVGQCISQSEQIAGVNISQDNQIACKQIIQDYLKKEVKDE